MTTLRLKNYSDRKWRGWIRTTTDHWADQPAPRALQYKDIAVVVGSPAGHNLRNIDIYCALQPGEGRDIEFSLMQPMADDIVEGILSGIDASVIADEDDVYEVKIDGAAVVRSRQRIKNGVSHFVFGRTYPGFDAVLEVDGACVVHNQTSKNVVFQDDSQSNGWSVVGSTIPVGSSISLADTQGFGYSCIKFRIESLLQDEQVANNVYILANKLVHAHALNKLYPGHGVGWPVFRGDAALWVNTKAPVEKNAIKGFNRGNLGPLKDMAATGEQEDQLFLGGEGRFLPGAWVPRYYAALGQWRYPCHTMTLIGQFPDPNVHFCAYQLGHPEARFGGNTTLERTSWPKASETNGWIRGMDEEHWLINNLCVAARMSGSPSLQLQLKFHAISWLFTCTIRQGLTTTNRPGAARAFGYKAYVAWLLYHYLADRDLANRVLSQAKVWLPMIVEAQKRKTVNGWWDVRTDPRLGEGRWAMPWQQVIGAYGVWKLAELLEHHDISSWAQESAGFLRAKCYPVPDLTARPIYQINVDTGEFKFGDSDWTHYAFPLLDAMEGKIQEHIYMGSNRPADPYQPSKWVDPTVLTEDQWTKASNR